MSVEQRPGSLTGMPDDRLGTVAVSLAVSELTLTPDIVPAVMDRISRDAVAYPEQFDRRPRPPRLLMRPALEERSARRALSRLAIIAALAAIVVAIVVFAASASASAAGTAAPLPIGAIDGSLVTLGGEAREVDAVGQGVRILHVVTEAS